MASITKTKNGFRIRVSTVDNGQRKWQTETFVPKASTPAAARKEAELHAQLLEQQFRAGTKFDGAGMTFDQWVTVWEKDKGFGGAIEEGTRENYLDSIRLHVSPAFGSIQISEIEPLRLRSLRDDLINDGKAPATVRKIFAAASGVFECALEAGCIRSNPCRGVRLPKQRTSHDLHYFTAEQAAAFLEACREQESYQFYAFYTLAIYGGFRRSEILGLTWDDINYEAHTVAIAKAVTRTKSGMKEKGPKTEAGRREISLPAACFDVLRQLRAEQLRTMLQHPEFKDHGYLFTQANGSRMDLSTPSHKFLKIVGKYNASHKEAEQLPCITLHDLRHTSATLLIAGHVDIETVSHRLGHSKASVTLDIYAHAMEETDRSAAEYLNGVLKNARKA